MTDTVDTTENNTNNAASISEEDQERMMHAIASDMIQNTNIIQAFEIVRERALTFAQEHISGLSDNEKADLLVKVNENEKKMKEEHEARQKKMQETQENPEEGAVVS